VNLADKIAGLSSPRESLCVLELGAGLGALTDRLLQRGHRVIAVERDRDLIPVLSSLFSEQIGSGSLEVLEEDAKALDWLAVFNEREATPNRGVESTQTGLVLSGNLPYQITGPLLEKTVHLGRHIERAVYLVQKEVADRLVAQPGKKIYGALSVFVQAQFKVERAFVIKGGAFHPQPRVDSAVVVLTPLPNAWSEETAEFRKVVKAAFATRRKTLRNAWKALCSAEQLQSIADECGIDLQKRGETLGVETFAAVAQALAAREVSKDTMVR